MKVICMRRDFVEGHGSVKDLGPEEGNEDVGDDKVVVFPAHLAHHARPLPVRLHVSPLAILKASDILNLTSVSDIILKKATEGEKFQ